MGIVAAARRRGRYWRVRVPVNVTMSDAVTAKARLLTVICVAAGLVEAVSETTGTMPGWDRRG